uniref:BUB1 N-terminal domain-containing protein n=1 Tax=Trichobilharzia regenti TaxID=157069 RepID=A0AA85JL87_TRIRE|nr:unnamed protein product [Trichobilharzia regenti]
MSDSDNFEWELSKENVKPLKSGRSVDLLNKVLSSQRSSEFQLKRHLLREYFELKLASLPASNEKFYLYIRYIKWIEQNYPTLGRCADLQNVLYRCIRDSSGLSDIKNNNDYVDCWMKLTEYCDQPTELCELLFRQGVGTMCSALYVKWCELLEKGKNYRKIASIFAHGLRAGARPLLWLEDRAESFFHRYENCFKFSANNVNNNDDHMSVWSKNLFPEPSGSHNQIQTENTRQKLASLRLIESGGRSENLVAPVVRTREMWHPNQSGLGTLNPTSKSTSNTYNYQIKVDKISQENPILLSDLPPITETTTLPLNNQTLDFIRPAGMLSSFQKENLKEPGPWKDVKITSGLPVPSSVRPTSEPGWQIFTEDQGDPQQKQSDTSNATNYVQPPVCNVKRKGLKVVKDFSEGDDARQQKSVKTSYIEVESFNRLLNFNGCTKELYNNNNTGDITTNNNNNNNGAEDKNKELLTKLNLPSLPGDKTPDFECFAFDISLIYGGIEELCWEMHRGVKWNIEYADVHRITNPPQERCRNNSSNDWSREEAKLINEIDDIINGVKDTTTTSTTLNNEFSKIENVQSTRQTLIKALENIALNQG